jgi:hypothetical protein
MSLPFEWLHEAALRHETDRRLTQIGKNKNTLTYEPLMGAALPSIGFRGAAQQAAGTLLRL